MKKIIIVVILCMSGYLIQAQDIIYTKREGIIKGKVVEIGETLIHYKKIENMDGPNYTINSRFVDSIKYENGSKEVFSFKGRRLSERNIREIEAFRGLPNNLVSTGFDLSMFNPTSPFAYGGRDQTPFAGWYLSYERLFLKQMLGVSVSPFAAWNRRYYGVSATAQFYPKNTGRMRFGVGPTFNYSIQNHTYQYSFFPSGSDSSSGPVYVTARSNVHITSLALNISLLNNITKNVFIDCDLFLGGMLNRKVIGDHQPDTWTSVNESDKPMMGIRLGVGYRF